MQICAHLSLHASAVVAVVAFVVGLGLDGLSSHHDISSCHSVAEVLHPPDHVTTGLGHVTVDAAAAVGIVGGGGNSDIGIGPACHTLLGVKVRRHQWVKWELR